MNPKIWGPHAWIFLHSITLAYPECPSKEDKENIKNFFVILGSVLPCSDCQNNYTNHLKKYPLTEKILSSKVKLQKWLVTVHNSVNKSQNKRLFSYEDFLNKYSKLYGGNNYLAFYLIVILFILFFIFIYIYFQIKK